MADERGIPSQGMTGQITENEDGSLDVKVLVLSGTEMYRDEIGAFVIDLESAALHKPTLIVDYNHEEGEVIGQISNLRYEDGGLYGDAHLYSARPGDRAEEVILRILGGTPYEISPTVQFGESDAAEVPEGFTDIVNGREVPGPALIFRNTPIRGVSICPYGTDRFTKVLKLSLKQAEETQMADNETKVPEAAHPDLEAMIGEFGEADGLKYYRAGLSLEEAQAADYEQLKAERAARLAAEEEKPAEPAPEEGGAEGGEGGGEGDGEAAPAEPAPEPEAAPEEEKKDEKDGLSAVLDQLKALGDTLTASLDQTKAELNTLKAALRRGEEEPVAPNAVPVDDKRDAVHRMADRIRENGIIKQ